MFHKSVSTTTKIVKFKLILLILLNFKVPVNQFSLEMFN